LYGTGSLLVLSTGLKTSLSESFVFKIVLFDTKVSFILIVLFAALSIAVLPWEKDYQQRRSRRDRKIRREGRRRAG
jgi:hypothetical protein